MHHIQLPLITAPTEGPGASFLPVSARPGLFAVHPLVLLQSVRAKRLDPARLYGVTTSSRGAQADTVRQHAFASLKSAPHISAGGACFADYSSPGLYVCLTESLSVANHALLDWFVGKSEAAMPFPMSLPLESGFPLLHRFACSPPPRSARARGARGDTKTLLSLLSP